MFPLKPLRQGSARDDTRARKAMRRRRFLTLVLAMSAAGALYATMAVAHTSTPVANAAPGATFIATAATHAAKGTIPRRRKQASADDYPLATTGYQDRADVRAFIDELITEEPYDRAFLEDVFAQVRPQPSIIAAMTQPLVSPPKWYEYAPRFVNERRIAAGVDFWLAHEATLKRAQDQFGVPPEIVVAIIGVETFYGRNAGGYRVLDALSTLAFDYPRRADFFRRELKHFLLLTRELKLSPLLPKGSFAGAMGLPQFMPSSFRNYALDFDGDGVIDIWGSADDAIGSVANFLARHDWQAGQPVLLPATIEPRAIDTLEGRLDGGLSERRSLDAWRSEGIEAVTVPAGIDVESVGLLLLEENDGPSYWLAGANFFVLTRYNRSRLYAAAVFNLAQAIHLAYMMR